LLRVTRRQGVPSLWLTPKDPLKIHYPGGSRNDERRNNTPPLQKNNYKAKGLNYPHPGYD
ncbi:MAG: hypothetical protein KZQ77_17935, partial [Candidatus Thiodiazotropha sp. (ex Notomyrtea botanica)]|nr:hypothetical protein [Candidatus Thiodiazotropha sp. (ex Notomyrtea botanica)]